MQELLSRLIDKKSADTPFLVQVLHLANRHDEIFHRGYVYEKPRKVKAQVQQPLISNEDGFYDNLPMLKSKKGKGAQQQLRLTKAEKDAMKLQRMEQQQAELAAKIAAMREAAADAEGDDASNHAASRRSHGGSAGFNGGEEEDKSEAQSQQPGSRSANIIRNQEEVEDE